MLQKKGFAVLEAADGNSGLELFTAKREEIGVVLLDMALPGKSGHEVLRELRRVRSHTKVIITSAYSYDVVQHLLLGARLEGYLQKPYQLTELVGLLRDALGQNDSLAERSGDSYSRIAESI